MNEQFNQNQPPQGPVYSGQTPPPPVQKKTSTKTIVAFVLAIVSVVLGVTVIGSLLGVILAIPALILSVKERRANPSALATAAFVLSIVGLVLCLIAFLVCLVYFGLAVIMHIEGYYDFFNYYDGLTITMTSTKIILMNLITLTIWKISSISKVIYRSEKGISLSPTDFFMP